MKKSLIIGIIVVIFIISIVAIIGVILTNYNKEKTSITSEEFKQIMENKEFFMIDATSQNTENEYIQKVYNAVESENRYQIEFYEYTDSDIANRFYKNMYSKLESGKGNSYSRTNISLKNYAKYMLTSNGRYTILSRVNNTIMYVSVSDEYKNEVKEIIEELGY